MSDIAIRTSGHAGRITLQRPKALNALTYDMIHAIEAALDAWQDDPCVDLIIIDAVGDKAFCAGGDIADLYRTGTAGDFAFGQTFWADEYRMNAKLSGFPKPVVSFLQGFIMGGGVGVGCHCSHRIVGESSQIAMPECGIGLVPDVGGSYLLARAPGQLGTYLGLTATRMGPGQAIIAGFADHFVPLDDWPSLITALEQSGDVAHVPDLPAPPDNFDADLAAINHHFAAPDLPALLASLRTEDMDFATKTLKSLSRNSPLAMACALRMIPSLRNKTIHDALALEYRFTSRAMEHGDFLEGIRAAIIDKDRTPKWKHDLDSIPVKDIDVMLAPLGAQELL